MRKSKKGASLIVVIFVTTAITLLLASTIIIVANYNINILGNVDKLQERINPTKGE